LHDNSKYLKIKCFVTVTTLNLLHISTKISRYQMTATRSSIHQEWNLLRVELIPDGETVDAMQLGKAINDARKTKGGSVGGGGLSGGGLGGGAGGGGGSNTNAGAQGGSRTTRKWRMTG
jgi:hypothetical protein